MKDPIPVSIKPVAVQLGRIAPRDREVTFRATGRSRAGKLNTAAKCHRWNISDAMPIS